MISHLTVNKEGLYYMNFKRFKDGLLGLKEIMMEIKNTKDECELKILELIKTRKKLKEFRIEKKKS